MISLGDRRWTGLTRGALAGALLGALALAACGDDLAPAPDAGGADRDPAAVAARLRATLDDLAALGERRAGSAAGAMAAAMLEQRFAAAGLADVHREAFGFPAFELTGSSLEVTVDGAPLAMAHDVFYYSGVGAVTDGELVDVGAGRPGDYAGLDVSGKIVLVERDARFHRSAQYREVLARGGAAMLYVSTAPDNLIQIGTVADGGEPLTAVPTITVGADDGAAIRAALAGGQTVRVSLAVDAMLVPAEGENVLATLPGRDPDAGTILIGAHFDSWYAGAADNGTGVAALLELAEALAATPERAFTLQFVGYDGEEIGLYGGYDYLRDHVIVGGDPVALVVNLEMPATGTDDTRALGHSNHAPLDEALEDIGARELYPIFVGMEAVPALFGGIIPTDIQGMYWAGLAGFSTACDSPYYHTPEDTPDKIDVGFLADAVIRFQDALAALDAGGAVTTAGLRVHDPEVWKLAVSATAAGDDQSIAITVTDAAGAPQAGAVVTAWVAVDGFTRSFQATTTSDADGDATVVLPAAALAAGSGDRWLHVTAGETYPLAEAIRPL